MLSSTAFAEGFDARQFSPIAGSEGVFSVESTQTLEHLDYDIKLLADYANTPLQFSCTHEGCPAKLEHLLTASLSAAIGVLNFLEVGIVLPFIPYEGYNAGFKDRQGQKRISSQRGVFGDMQIRAKGRILKRSDYHGFGLGAGLVLTMPTGNASAYVGSASVTGHPYVSLDYEIGPVEMMLNIGMTFRKKTTFLDYNLGQGFNYGFGLNYHVIEDWLDLKGELFGETPMSKDATKNYHNSAEFLLGAKLMTPIGLHVTTGAGAGIGNGTRNPGYRVLLGLEYQPRVSDTDGDGIYDHRDLCVTIAGSADFEGCPNPDTDSDGWCDPWIESDEMATRFECIRTDACPLNAGIEAYNGCPEPDSDADGWCDAWIEDKAIADNFGCKMTDACETLEGIDDFYGCPSPDTDGDGWCDPWVNDEETAQAHQCKMTDLCPLLAGDDEFTGCPDPDADGDGICAAFVSELGLYEHFFCSGIDQCSNEAEDFDDFQDDDGCPDPDNDNDGICDPWVSELGLQDKYANICVGNDLCPNEPETINGYQDDDGCPDTGKQYVIVKDDKIEILDTLYFDTNKATIKEKSHSLLNQLAQTMMAHKEIVHVDVEGHTDDTGKYERNVILSQQRAESVRNYLIARGVEQNRLGAKGYGPDKPIDPAKTKKARALNRRVEFIITQRSSQ